MKNDALYMIVPYGIGDAIVLCGLKNYIEDHYGAEVIPVLKPSQEIIPKLYGIEKYKLEVLGEEELKAIASSVKLPAPGKLFVAHPAFGNKHLNIRFLNHELSFVDMFCEHFGIDQGFKIDFPSGLPEAGTELKEKLGCSDYSDVALFAPEMKSASETERIQDRRFLEMAREYEKNGFKIVVNCDAHKAVYGDYAVNLSLEELAYLGLNAGKVISSRSGFCDLVYGFAGDMDILYPNKAFYDLFSMKQIFTHTNLNVSEKVFSLAEELRKSGYRNAAIYGYGNVGRRIRYSLESEGYTVSFAIDREQLEDEGIDIYSIDQEIPETDIVIITIPDDGSIERKLNGKRLKALNLMSLM